MQVLRFFITLETGKQINATFNPDFGQAESDDVVINFSARETFYSEKERFLLKINLYLMSVIMIVIL